jgi:hypothetical protein
MPLENFDAKFEVSLEKLRGMLLWGQMNRENFSKIVCYFGGMLLWVVNNIKFDCGQTKNFKSMLFWGICYFGSRLYK